MKKVVLGMSGGVDSAVAALLLKNNGYEVIGVTFKMLEDFDATKASNTAKMLDIKHYVVDLTKEFKNEIIDSFNNDYKIGRTPNPCVLCNKKIKFKYMEETRKKYNADFIATGHYAKVENSKIYKSSDLNKDQSYFLSSIDKSIINKLIFPLEGLSKEEVRKIALENNLPSASNKDSFDVCFIGNNKFKDYIKETLESTPGSIINVQTKEIIGKHEGLMNYTIGQRKNIGLSGNSERCYVCGKDIDKNILYVAFGSSEYLLSNECDLENVNFIVDNIPENLNAVFRYHGTSYPALISVNNDKVKVYTKTLAKNITPGQTCALYSDNLCVGSGVISKVYLDGKELWYLK